MPTMLRQKGTGDMYIYSDGMAKRSDMEVVDVPDIAPPASAPAPVPAAKPAPKKAKRVSAPPVAVEPAGPAEEAADALGDELDDLFAGFDGPVEE